MARASSSRLARTAGRLGANPISDEGAGARRTLRLFAVPAPLVGSRAEQRTKSPCAWTAAGYIASHHGRAGRRRGIRTWRSSRSHRWAQRSPFLFGALVEHRAKTGAIGRRNDGVGRSHLGNGAADRRSFGLFACAGAGVGPPTAAAAGHGGKD